MIIPGLPEHISHENYMAASDTLGLPRNGRITKVEMRPGTVEVTFLREHDDEHAGVDPTKASVLPGGPSTLAKVTVPIKVDSPKPAAHEYVDSPPPGGTCQVCGVRWVNHTPLDPDRH